MTTPDTDVLVAGAGGAGLGAALRAAQLGMNVAVVEWRDNFEHANNTSMSTAMIPAGGSRYQRVAGVTDSPEQFLEDVMAKTKGTADPVIARALVEVAPELVEWLADHVHVPIELATELRYPGHSAERMHTVPDRSGATLLRYLVEAADRTPEITIAKPLRIKEVVIEDGLLRSTVETPSGECEDIRSRAVVLATGGFGANPAMVAAHIPEIAAAVYNGGDGCHGDAIAIGQRLGARVGFLDAYQGHGSLAYPHSILMTWAAVVHGAILVNSEGRRFGDESTGYSEFARQVIDQPGSEAYVVFDRRVHELCSSFADHQALEAAGAIRWSDDVEALAQRVGCPPAELQATLDAADAAATGQAEDRFGRASWGGRLTAPFASVRVTGALFHTQGGLLVDANARCLGDGGPITGLYAAGGSAAGMSGTGASGYLAGNGLLAALGLGYLAGGHAATTLGDR